MGQLIFFFHLCRSTDKENDENNNGPPVKKCKTGTINDVNEIIEKKMKSQNTELTKLRNKLKELKPDDLVAILNANKQFVPEEKSKVSSLEMHTKSLFTNCIRFIRNNRFWIM